MPLNADILLDRIHLKRQITRWRIFTALALLIPLIIYAEMRGNGSHTAIMGDHIARITIDGVVVDDPKRDEMIADIRDNNSIKAVIVRLDTPGGTAVGGEELYRQLVELGKVKPVVSVMRTMSTSAGYMIALGTDHIVAREGTITGSIGVLMQFAEFTDLAAKLGITPISVKSAPLKGSPSPLEKFSPEARAAIQSVIDDFYNTFVHMVMERRGFTHEQAIKVSDGRVYTGVQALQLKLIDELGGEDEAVAWLEKERKIKPGLDIEDVKPKKEHLGFLEEFADSAASRFIPKSFTPGLDGLVAIWHPEVQIQ